jgi:DNA-binding MarR family transcriptional regulator
VLDLYCCPVTRDQSDDADRAATTDALMATSRLMTAVVARTLADVDDSISVPQFRVLVMLSYEPSLSLGMVAEGLGVNPSNASRACDKLVAARLVHRADDDRDRRQLRISLTSKGRRLLDSVMESRRRLLDDLVAEMAPIDQRRLTRGLTALLAVLGDEEPTTRLGTRPGDIIHWVR